MSTAIPRAAQRLPAQGRRFLPGSGHGDGPGDRRTRVSYGREGEIVRCALHGWEFEIATGRALADPRARAHTYMLEVQDGRVVVVV